MTPQEARERAEAYVDRVLKSQRDLGHGGELSDEDYRRTVDRAAQALTELAEPEREPDADEQAVPA